MFHIDFKKNHEKGDFNEELYFLRKPWTSTPCGCVENRALAQCKTMGYKVLYVFILSSLTWFSEIDSKWITYRGNSTCGKFKLIDVLLLVSITFTFFTWENFYVKTFHSELACHRMTNTFICVGPFSFFLPAQMDSSPTHLCIKKNKLKWKAVDERHR